MTSNSLAPARSYMAGCTLVVVAGLVLSLGVICIRDASASDAWQYLFWRALGFGLVLALVAARRRVNPLAQIRRMGGIAWVSVLALAASQICFIAAIKSGSTAEVFFLIALAPLMAAALARPLLGERIGVQGTLAIAVALGGVALMSGVGVETNGLHSAWWEGEWLTWMLALGSAFTFSLYLLATRRARSEDLDAALVAVSIVTALVSLTILQWLGLPFAANLHDAALGLLHGGVILAIGLMLFARGSRVVPGVTLVTLTQTETVAAPIWTYLVFNETTTLTVVVGGALILIAIIMQASDGASTAQRDTAARGASRA